MQQTAKVLSSDTKMECSNEYYLLREDFARTADCSVQTSLMTLKCNRESCRITPE